LILVRAIRFKLIP